jgi:tRNA(Arg) A34 adenosine deaminase TadA
MSLIENRFLERAIALSKKGMNAGCGGPFGCVIVKNGEIIGEGYNEVLDRKDPTAHAEIVAIRNACKTLGNFQLTGCDVYTSCEPCPMCMGAIYWARPQRVIFANTKADAAAVNFDDQFIYDEIEKLPQDRYIQFIHMPHEEARAVFLEWKNNDERKQY